jgi:predicted aldo/keto reductase-like oxidoreductase
MKIFANGYLLRAFGVKQCLDYTLSLPAHVAVLGCSTLGQLEDDVRIAQNFKPLTNEQMDALRARAVEKHREVSNGPALEYWKKEVQP